MLLRRVLPVPDAGDPFVQGLTGSAAPAITNRNLITRNSRPYMQSDTLDDDAAMAELILQAKRDAEKKPTVTTAPSWMMPKPGVRLMPAIITAGTKKPVPFLPPAKFDPTVAIAEKPLTYYEQKTTAGGGGNPQGFALPKNNVENMFMTYDQDDETDEETDKEKDLPLPDTSLPVDAWGPREYAYEQLWQSYMDSLKKVQDAQKAEKEAEEKRRNAKSDAENIKNKTLSDGWYGFKFLDEWYKKADKLLPLAGDAAKLAGEVVQSFKNRYFMVDPNTFAEFSNDLNELGNTTWSWYDLPFGFYAYTGPSDQAIDKEKQAVNEMLSAQEWLKICEEERDKYRWNLMHFNEYYRQKQERHSK